MRKHIVTPGYAEVDADIVVGSEYVLINTEGWYFSREDWDYVRDQLWPESYEMPEGTWLPSASAYLEGPERWGLEDQA